MNEEVDDSVLDIAVTNDSRTARGVPGICYQVVTSVVPFQRAEQGDVAAAVQLEPYSRAGVLRGGQAVAGSG